MYLIMDGLLVIRFKGFNCYVTAKRWAKQCGNHFYLFLPAHDVAQLVQVGGAEVNVVAVAALHVLVNAVQVQCVQVQELLLQHGSTQGRSLHSSHLIQGAFCHHTAAIHPPSAQGSPAAGVQPLNYAVKYNRFVSIHI